MERALFLDYFAVVDNVLRANFFMLHFLFSHVTIVISSCCIFAPLRTFLMEKVLGNSFCASVKLTSYIFCNITRYFGQLLSQSHFS